MTKLYRGSLVLYNSQLYFAFRVLFRLLHDTDWLLELWHWEVSAWSRFLNRKRGVREIERNKHWAVLRRLSRWREGHGDSGAGTLDHDRTVKMTFTHRHWAINTRPHDSPFMKSQFSSRWRSYNTQSSSSLHSDKIYTNNMPVLGSKNVPVDKVSSSFSPPTFSLVTNVHDSR